MTIFEVIWKDFTTQPPFTDEFYVVDLAGDRQWENLQAMPIGMYNLAMTSSLDEKFLYTFGGKSSHFLGTYEPRTFKYDIDQDQWTVLAGATRAATVTAL